MLKLMKYLKSSTGYIILIILLLGLQAYSDLSLPQYTSDIVNVGIQQGGITESIPKVIREGEMSRLLFFLKESEQAEILEYYNLDGGHYSIKEETSLENSELISLLKKPILILSFLDSENESNMGISEEMIGSLLPSVDQQIELLPESIIGQMMVSYVKNEYKALGLNMDSIQTKYILITGIKMLGYALIGMVASISVVFLAARISATMGRDLRGVVFKKVLSFSSVEFDQFSTASLITRTTNDIQQIQGMFVMLIRILFYAPILGLGGVLKVFNTNTSMAWIIGVAVATLMIIIGFLFAVVMPKFKLMQKLVDKVNLVTREILTGLSVVRAFNREQYEEDRFDKANRNLTKTTLFVNRVMTFMMPLMMLVMNLITILIVWVGAHGVDVGSMQVGDMMAFISYTMQIIMAFLMISMISIMLPRATVSANRIDEIIVTKGSILEPEVSKVDKMVTKGVIEFDHVHFSYPNADEEVLRDISFKANPGETLAFIGSTGSGKSTLVNLIPRFYDVTKGRILIDGVDIRDIKLSELRDKLGLVPQKGVLFSGTIESNIKYGNEMADDVEMERAARIAQAQDFIKERPEGYDSEISQGGSNVSGGQKQRLSIARAIAKNPDIYIFDDSFSALDYKTDMVLRAALKKEIKESTVLIVAQRISTILNADQIIVLDEGKVAGIGTHKELIKTNEVYRQIAMSQLSEKELGIQEHDFKEVTKDE